ncbi:MAG: lamin tail domain-containing protein [Acidobacteria bacterium]|nr:lamin tail domain-containing protein [Acidobacteriota bacterium]
MLRLRPLAVLLSLALALCLLGLWSARSQTGALRRITNTTEDGVNVNPSLSGDGRRIAFESTKDIAGAGGNGFHALRADVASDPATFIQMGVTRAPAPGISQDGSIIAFASRDNPLGTNADGNSEIFLFDGTTLRQVTNTTPVSASERTRQGNFQPSLTDDGRFIAFSSNRDLANQNADGNFEIYIFDTASNTFTQLTSAAGTVGATDAKISGNGARVAYIRDNNSLPAVQRDLVLQNRADGTIRVLAGSVTNLAFTYGRAISDDGSRIVYSADAAPNSSQVFLFDGRVTDSARQITALGVRETEVPLHPTISGDGTRIAFATRRPVPTTGSNSDNSVELYTFDIPTGQFGRVTNVTSSVADGFDGSLRAAEVISSLSDDGAIVAFNFPRTLSGAVTSGFENNTEIYMTGTAVRPSVGTLTVLNGASFGNEPATTEAVAPDSIAVARGGVLSFTTVQAQRQADGTFPRTLGGTTVTVNGRAAQIFFVSPDQINFHVPAETELGTAEVIVTNSEGFQSRGTVPVLRAAPGIFTISGDGLGEGMILNADTLQPGPFDPSSGQLRLVIFATGVRDATQVTVTAGGRALTVESVSKTPNMPGMDEVRVLIPADLRGAGQIDLVIRADNRDSNLVTVIFAGDSCRNIVINEVLADPPEGLDGDANRDGARSSSEDEFIELVNRTNADIDISGYQLTARSTSSSTDTVRHTFAPGTIFPAGSAIVVFGGGNPNVADPAFGGALVLKASSGGLSLTNSGGVITLRQPSQDIVTIFSYGGSTGLNGDANQSLTRSPDADRDSSVCAGFVLHSSVPGSNGGPFSPGTRVNGAPFAINTVTRIEVSPATATIDAGAKQQFTATAYDANNNVVSGVIFFWQSSNTAVATIDQTGLATAVSAGTTEIRASARGVQSAPAILTVRAVERILTSVEVTPSPATIPVGGTQQFTARGLDQFGNEIMGLTFAWESTNTNVATIDAATGLATAVSQGQTTIRATSQGVTGTATLNVTAPTVVINEVLADPPDGIAGDANRDGVRDSSDDEFVELVNSTSGGINISGWTIRTRAASGTESVRHTFAANTTLPASEAIVVFGGGTPESTNSAFGCAQVVTASSGGLSLTNSGLTVVVRDSAGNLVAQFTYGGSTGLNADSNQSLTRSPDITGSFRTHTTAPGSGPRLFSPGTRVDGTPFGSCPARLTSVAISPPSASVIAGQSTQFTAQAFNQFGQPMTGVTITFTSDNTAVATVGTVTTDPGTGIATATVTGQSPGTARITATATDGTTTVTSSQATLTVNSSAITYSVSGRVTDGSGNPLSDVLITFDLNSQGTLSSKTTTTDANGNYSSGDLGCQNNVRVTPSKAGLTFNPAAIAFVTSSQCLTGSNTANFTGAPPPPGNLVISQLYVGGGNASATYRNDFVEIFNRGTTTVDFSVTPYSIQFVGIGGSFGSTSANSKTNITAGTIAPGQYFLVQEASGGAVGAALPTPDATGTINLLSAGGKVALVVGTSALPASSCPGDDGASPFIPNNPAIADFVGYGSNADTPGHCYEGPGPAAAPNSTNADFRKAGGCLDTNFNANDFLVATPSPRNTSSPLNDCSAGLKPDITINDPAAVSESSANATFIVTLSTASTSTVSVDYATANGTATAGSDYQSTSGTLTFAPGETNKSILVPIINDTMDEPSETFFVNLTNAPNAVILDNQGQGTITDDDAAPSLSIDNVSVTEGNSGTTNATFNVTLSAASGQPVTVNFATADGTATAGTDYQSTSGTLTFNPGQTTQTITVLVNGDTTFEPNETFLINLTTPTNATISDNQGQGTITNDDAAPPIPAITINDVSVTEGASGTKTLDFTVSLSMTPTATITVDYATANGTATAGSDYQSTNGTVTFAPGETSKTISVIINGDTLVEPDETFFVNLTNASSNSVITDNQGVGTITNDDTANLVISQVYGGGGLTNAALTNDFVEIFNRGTTTVNFAVTPYSIQYAGATSNFGGTTSSSLTAINSGTIAPGQYFLVQQASGGAVGAAPPAPDATGSINLAATAGKVALVFGTTAVSATSCPGDDLSTAQTNPSGNNIVDFVGYGTSATCYEGAGPAPAPSNTTADFRKTGGCVDTNDNAADFLVAAPNPRNTSSPINDCSSGLQPDITINDVTVTEGDTGTKTVDFTVTLSTSSTQTVTVDYATANGTAIAGSDYQSASGTLTFNPGETSKVITITIVGDIMDEPSETFFVNLTNATNGVLLDSQGQGTITDNDAAPTISINDVSVAEGDGGTTPATFTVTLSAPSAFTVTVNYATADGSANNPGDYQSTSGTLTFNPGETSKTITVSVNGDTTFESNETFVVDLSSASNATIADGQGQGTIINDDAAPPVPAITINDVNVAEGNSGTTTVDFTVSLSMTSTQTVTVDYATADGTATAPTDYLSTNGTLTFNPGDTSKTITVTINGDTLVETAETFVVNLTNATNAFISDAQGQGTITNDDTANLVISQVYGGGGNSGATYTHDFIEIFNRGTATVNFAVTPYSVQYAAASSSFGSNLTVINSGTIAPGQYFLIQEFAPASPVGVALPTPDATGSINLAVSGGKVALVSGTAAVSLDPCPGDDLSTTPTNPSGNNIVDFLGYGSASCYEGTGPAPAHTNTTADFRKAGGCLDTNDNGADFLVATPNPRNTSSPLNNCSSGLRPEITINNAAAVLESAANATFTVTLSTPTTLTVTVDYATADGTATAGSDYQSTTGTLTFAPGETTKTILVPIINDSLDESSETFLVNLTNATNGVIFDNQGQGTITDDDAAPTLSINDTTVTEGDSGTTQADFTVTLSAASGQTVTVNYATADGTANTPGDYQSASGTLTFNPGETTKTVSVLVNGDTTFEQNETFFVNLSGAANATILDAQGQGTITNDDAAPPTPSLSITDVSVTEGDAGTKTVDFTVTLSPASTGTVTVDYATAGNSATAPSDYLSTSGTLTFNPGETAKTITITINGDTLVESNETFFVNLSNQSANAAILDAQGVGTITNDDAANLVISQVYGGGGNGGATYTHDFIEIFNRGTTIVDVTGWSVQYSAATGTAAFAVTPICPTGPCLIQPGKYFLVQEASGGAIGSPLPTPDASGTIIMAATAGRVALVTSTTPIPANSSCGQQLAAAVDFVGYGTTAICFEGSGPAPAPSATLADFRKSGGCLDTDQNATDFFVASPAPRNSSSPLNDCSGGLRPDITINDRALSEGTTPHDFTVTLSMASTQTVTVDYSTANGTATAGVDYTAVSGTLTFAPGETTKTINVPIINDTLDEPNETYFVNLSNASNAILVDNQGQGTINDNDATPTLSINSVLVTEGDSGTKTLDFTVTLSAASGQTVTVDYATADNTATAGTDYQAASGTLTFIPGDTTETISVTINGDTTVEPDETFFVNLTNPVNATLTTAQGTGTIQNDDVTPSIIITDVTENEGNAGTTAFTFTVSLSTASTQTVTVNYATADNTAIAPGDYTAIASTQLSFAPGETSKQVTVQVNGDTQVEANETFFVNLSGATNATIADNQGVGTITNDDAAAAASADLSLTKTVNNSTPNIGERVVFTITLNNAGTDAATGVQVTDLLPAGLTFVSALPSQGTYTSGTGVWDVGTVSVGSPAATLTITATVATIGAKVNTAQVTASGTPDPDSTPNDGAGDDFSSVTVTGAANLVINEVVTSPPSSSPPADANDFVELYNKSATQAIDISGLVISSRASASTTTVNTFTLPGAPGSGTTVIQPNSYLIIVNGASAYGTAADFDASASSFNLTATSGGIKIELNGVKLDGLAYQSAAANTIPATFAAFGEGTPFTSPVASGLQDYIRSPNGADTDSNVTDFRRNGTTANVTEKAANPTIP